MDKETALKVLISLIENNKLILKTHTAVSAEEYNKYVADTIIEVYNRLIDSQ